MAMNHIDRVVDVEGHSIGGRGVARTVEINQYAHQPDQLTKARRVLPARHRRLRAEISAAVGKPIAGQLESRIGAQPIEIVGILKAAGDRQNACAQDVRQEVDDAIGIAPVGDLGRQLPANPEAAFGGCQKDDAAVRSDPAAIKGGGHLLAGNSWKGEWQQRIVGHGGCGNLDPVNRWLRHPFFTLTQSLTILPPVHRRIRSASSRTRQRRHPHRPVGTTRPMTDRRRPAAERFVVFLVFILIHIYLAYHFFAHTRRTKNPA